MKTIFGLLFVLLLTACAAPGQPGLLDPSVSAGNDKFVSLYDPMGLPNASYHMAVWYCQTYGKSPVPQGRGGAGALCSGNGQSLCMTYLCM